jgi:hypothetical protein
VKGEEVVVAEVPLTYYPVISLEGLRKITKDFIQNNGCPSQGVTRAPSPVQLARPTLLIVRSPFCVSNFRVAGPIFTKLGMYTI